MFSECYSLENINLPQLTTISGDYCTYQMFYTNNGNNVKTVDLPELTTISGTYAANCMFYNNNNLETVNLPKLTTLSGDYICGGMFNGANLKSISFPQLTTIEGYAPFGYETWEYTFANCYNLTEIHFRSDMRSAVEALPGYDSKWGATSATVYFDL
jgi:hypothetical protein